VSILLLPLILIFVSLSLVIVDLHDVFESSTFIFLVFELCRNGELFDHLTNVVTLSEKKTRYIMKQVCVKKCNILF
jgi:phosphorylase kinase gamma subunit